MEELPTVGFELELEKFSTPALRPPLFAIHVGSTNEDVVLFLERRKAGDPVPANVTTEVNPFSLEPWDLPEGMWYLYNSSTYQSCTQGRNIEVTRVGYWKPMGDVTIFTNNDTSATKTTLEFYIGLAPLGNRTGWKMYEYHRDEKNVLRDYKSMCRVFWQNCGSSKFCDFKLSDDDNDDVAEGPDSILMRFLEDEGSSSETDAPNKSQPFTGSEQVVQAVAEPEEMQPTLIDTIFQDSNSSSTSEPHAYVELNDLLDPNSASSSSDNSSFISDNSDDYFDPEELLKYLRSSTSSSTIQPAKPPGNAENLPKKTHSRSSDSSSSSSGKKRRSLIMQ